MLTTNENNENDSEEESETASLELEFKRRYHAFMILKSTLGSRPV